MKPTVLIFLSSSRLPDCRVPAISPSNFGILPVHIIKKIFSRWSPRLDSERDTGRRDIEGGVGEASSQPIKGPPIGNT